MSTRALARLCPLALALALMGASCPSAYDKTYQQETQRLEQQQQAEQAAASAAHAEASKYAAVVYFKTGSAVLDEDGYSQLRWLTEKLGPYPQSILLVQGFADATGGDSINQKLSQERAEAVALYLTNQGFDRSRLKVQGFAANYEAASNADAKGRRNNRRVEVTVQ